MHWRRKWQPTPVFLPGESQGWRSLVGCRLLGHTESDTTDAIWQQQTIDSLQKKKEKKLFKTHYNKTAKIKAKEKKIVIYKGMPVKLSVHLSAEILQAQREWNDIFNVTQKKKKHSIWKCYL